MSQVPTGVERRHFWRASFHAGAELTLPAGATAAELRDISLKGALVELPAVDLARLDETCRLRLALDDFGDAIVMDATVVHVHDRLAGLRCDAIDLDSITHLRRLVELNAGDPQLLERELSALIRD